MRTFREDLIRNWYKVLRRRGQKRRINWQTFSPIVKFWIPPLKVMHPHPNERVSGAALFTPPGGCRGELN